MLACRKKTVRSEVRTAAAVPAYLVEAGDVDVAEEVVISRACTVREAWEAGVGDERKVYGQGKALTTLHVSRNHGLLTNSS